MLKRCRCRQKCTCRWCRCKKGLGFLGMTAEAEEEDSLEIISLGSADDIVIIPSEVYPLEMVATLDIAEGDVAGKKDGKKRRTRVPEKPDKPLSLWSLIKSAIGKDLTRFPLPVNFAEPLSMLQRLAEDYEYSAILNNASKMKDSLEQLATVAAFTITSYSSCSSRTAKPFNPLLGETYEFDRTDDMGWRCIAEQVCHHPPIAAFHCESMGWVQWQQFSMKSHFRGTYLEIHPIGVAHLRFKTSENHYTWRKVTTLVRNLYLGKLYIEQEGETDVINHTTNERCHLKYTCGGLFSKDKHVTGKVYNRANEAKFEVHGTWDSEVYISRLDSSGKRISSETKLAWRRNSLPPEAEKRYNFSVFTAQLNEQDDSVAPTDSRRRPDQRYMENGRWDEANAEKQRLEDKQRETRRRRISDAAYKLSTSSRLHVKSGMTTASVQNSTTEDGVEPYYSPAWFTRQNDPISGQHMYVYNGEYWECKGNQDWERCPALFDK